MSRVRPFAPVFTTVLVALVGCSTDDFSQAPPPAKAKLTVVVAGAGSVTSGDGAINCGGAATACAADLTLPATGGAMTTLTATPTPASRFVGWSAPCAKAPVCTLEVTAATTVTATFEPKVELTVDYQLDADATSTVSSVPPGISASKTGTTSAFFDPGTQVVLSINLPANGEAFRFSGACAGVNGGPNGSTCTVTLDTAKTVKIRVAHYNYAFLTSSKSSANLGGLSGADTTCNALAATAGLPGTYVAFLSTETVDAQARLGTAEGWRRTDGAPIMVTKADSLGAGSIKSALLLDETGKLPLGLDLAFERTFTGSLLDGTKLNYANNDHCGNWTNTTGQVSQGSSAISGRAWLTAGAGPCTAQLRYMCFGADLNRPLPTPVAPSGARRAFMSSGSVSPNQGIAAFDQLCQTEAAGAGLANAGKFLALVAPSNGTSAASRFDTTKGPWVGTDDVPLAPDAKSLMETYPWTAGIHRSASGVAPTGVPSVLTGYRVTTLLTAPRPADPGNYTCSGWTSNDGGTKAGFGQASFSGHYAMSYLEADATQTCALTSYRLFCLEN